MLVHCLEIRGQSVHIQDSVTDTVGSEHTVTEFLMAGALLCLLTRLEAVVSDILFYLYPSTWPLLASYGFRSKVFAIATGREKRLCVPAVYFHDVAVFISFICACTVSCFVVYNRFFFYYSSARVIKGEQMIYCVQHKEFL